MHDVNKWLLALAFLIGLVLTFALMIRRVTREVPVTHTVSAGVAGAGATLSGAADRVGEFVETVGDKIEGLFERDTHGAGSARLTARRDAPAGYTVKFDPETRRYLTVDDAGYAELETEYWFTDEDSAKAAGFSRWDAFKGKVGDLVDRAGDKIGAAAGAVGAVAGSVGDKIEGLFERDTHGAGSARLTARRDAPAGYTVKFDPETKRYVTPGTAGYEEIEAEYWFTDEDSAKAAGFSRWDAFKGKVSDFFEAVGDKVGGSADATAAGLLGGAVAVASIDEVPAGPHGKGSAKAGPGGSGPAGWLIKGNEDSMLYHPPDSPAYKQTIAEVWFFDEETARKAGFEKWDKNFK